MIVIVQIKAVKIYVAEVEAVKKKERQAEPQFTTKIDGFLTFTAIPPPPLNANVLFCRSFGNLTLCMTKLKLGVLLLCLSSFTDCPPKNR